MQVFAPVLKEARKNAGRREFAHRFHLQGARALEVGVQPQAGHGVSLSVTDFPSCAVKWLTAAPLSKMPVLRAMLECALWSVSSR